MKPITRREALRHVAGSVGLLAASPALAASVPAERCPIGIGMHSYGYQWRDAKARPGGAKFHDALTFLQYAHRLGAAGVQVAIGDNDRAYAQRIKAEAEKHALYFEGQFQLPKDDTDLDRFERDVVLARDAGATVFRTACLSGRRYETFKSAEEFREFAARSQNSLRLAEPALKRHRLRMAVENHKDWLVPELLEIVRKFSSEWVGICVDTGNSIALMEDAMSVIEEYAPFAFSVHLKDMAFEEYGDGFLLAEVPLGRGFLPISRVVQILRKANPAVRLNLEMITRDPLRIPCFTDAYWATMRGTPASRFAQTLGTAKQHISKMPLPRLSEMPLEKQLLLEDEHVRASLSFAKAQPGP
jgi:sugar phosphate isomerase/epimerase